MPCLKCAFKAEHRRRVLVCIICTAFSQLCAERASTLRAVASGFGGKTLICFGRLGSVPRGGQPGRVSPFAAFFCFVMAVSAGLGRQIELQWWLWLITTMWLQVEYQMPRQHALDPPRLTLVRYIRGLECRASIMHTVQTGDALRRTAVPEKCDIQYSS